MPVTKSQVARLQAPSNIDELFPPEDMEELPEAPGLLTARKMGAYYRVLNAHGELGTFGVKSIRGVEEDCYNILYDDLSFKEKLKHHGQTVSRYVEEHAAWFQINRGNVHVALYGMACICILASLVWTITLKAQHYIGDCARWEKYPWKRYPHEKDAYCWSVEGALSLQPHILATASLAGVALAMSTRRTGRQVQRIANHVAGVVTKTYDYVHENVYHLRQRIKDYRNNVHYTQDVQCVDQLEKYQRRQREKAERLRHIKELCAPPVPPIQDTSDPTIQFIHQHKTERAPFTVSSPHNDILEPQKVDAPAPPRARCLPYVPTII